MPSRYLVTGGAGFVGSHLVLALADRGDHVVAIDTLRTGHRRAVAQGVRLIEGGIGDVALLDRVLPADGGFDAVFHLAAWSQVGESMSMPMQYLLANAADGFRLIDACVRHGVRRFVLSSTAALDVKQMGERSAGNPHVAFDVAGAGDVAWSRGISAKAGAPVLDPTERRTEASARAIERASSDPTQPGFHQLEKSSGTVSTRPRAATHFTVA